MMFSIFGYSHVAEWAFSYPHTYPGQVQTKHRSTAGRHEQRKIAFFARQRKKRNKK